MYILDRERQMMLIKEMAQLRKDNKNWIVYYHHPTTNEMWKSYFPYGPGDGQGPRIMRREPAPEDLIEWVDQCLNSELEDDAMGLGLDLSTTPQAWSKLIDYLESNYRNYPRKQLKIFLDYLCISEYRELFGKINYRPSEDGLSLDHFDGLSSRAKKLRIKRLLFFF